MRVLTVYVSVIALFFLTNILYTPAAQAKSIKVTAAIQPLRVIIVDKNFIIQKIASNTSEDVSPIVRLESADGEEMGYSVSIQRQYEFMKPSLNFTKPGIIYQHEDNRAQTFYKKIITFLSKDTWPQPRRPLMSSLCHMTPSPNFFCAGSRVRTYVARYGRQFYRLLRLTAPPSRLVRKFIFYIISPRKETRSTSFTLSRTNVLRASSFAIIPEWSM